MQPRDVAHVGVVGCGVMGSGIVEVCARAGLDVTFVEGTPDLIRAGEERIRASVDKAVARGKLTRSDADQLLARIGGASDLAALAGVDLVIEAATEDRVAKEAVFERLGELTRTEVVLASNTSSIPIASLGRASGRPDKVVGMHFFNPPPVMALLELTPSEHTSDQTYRFVRGFGTEVLAKTCVRASDEAGFIVNRLLLPYLYDAIRLHERGFASKEDIDTAMQLGLAHPMGPLALADLVGLDTVLYIGEVLRSALGGERYEAPELLERLVGEGKLGRKSGQGFYDYR